MSFIERVRYFFENLFYRDNEGYMADCFRSFPFTWR